MNLVWLTEILDRIFAAWRARSAARAGGELAEGQGQVDAIGKDVASIEGNIKAATHSEAEKK